MARKKISRAEEPVRIDDAQKAKLLADKAAQLANDAATALAAAEALGLKTKPLAHFWLAPAQRDVLMAVPEVPKAIKAKLRKEKPAFTVAEVARMMMALAEASTQGDPWKQMAVLLVAQHLTGHLQTGLVELGKSKPWTKSTAKTNPKTVYQFKITLIGSKPPIWRRIQVADCTLDKLHEHIQTSMGWTNSHLHQFRVGGQLYGDPLLMEENMEELDYQDSTRTSISSILPADGTRFSLNYEYDFGDSWNHEILFEGRPQGEPGREYPHCLEGERACPPEDVGGIGGFYTFLTALADPKHKRHRDFVDWAGDFDPQEFDAKRATEEMKKGLPDWRNEVL